AVTHEIAAAIRDQVLRRLRKRGVVLGLSGGIDSSVTAALCARALGPDKVFALLTPEKDSDPDSLRLGHLMVQALGLGSGVGDLDPILTGAGCYRRRDECIRKLVPAFGPGWGCKVVIADALAGEGYNLTQLVVQSPDGARQKLRMPLQV